MFNLKSQDPFIFEEIFEKNVYAISQKDIENKTVIDLGAYLGFFSLLCASYKAKQIITVEGNPFIYNKTLNNVKDIETITPINRIVYTESNIKKFISGKDGVSNIYSGNEYEVETISLEDVIKLTSSDNLVLKMDIEGTEHEVIPNVPDYILQKFDLILIEIHQNYENILKKLRQSGFMCSLLPVTMVDSFGTTINKTYRCIKK